MYNIVMKAILKLALVVVVVLVLSFLKSDDMSSLEQSVSEQETARVTYVIDGDTFELQNGDRIRLIGVDTPERDEYLYAEATEELRRLIDREEVRLVADVENTDRYGRLLRYVYIDGIFVNEELVRKGLADAKSYEPNTTLQRKLFEAEDYARSNKIGLWK
jgi:micrococcal nuclease